MIKLSEKKRQNKSVTKKLKKKEIDSQSQNCVIVEPKTTGQNGHVLCKSSKIFK